MMRLTRREKPKLLQGRRNFEQSLRAAARFLQFFAVRLGSGDESIRSCFTRFL